MAVRWRPVRSRARNEGTGKDTGSATKRPAKKTGHAVKRTTKKAANKTAEKTREGAEKVRRLGPSRTNREATTRGRFVQRAFPRRLRRGSAFHGKEGGSNGKHSIEPEPAIAPGEGVGKFIYLAAQLRSAVPSHLRSEPGGVRGQSQARPGRVAGENC